MASALSVLRASGANRRDVLLVAVVFIIGQQEAWLPVHGLSVRSGPDWLNAVVFAASTTALLWRRRFPLESLVFIVALLTAAGLAAGFSDGLAPLLPLLIGCYSVARWATRRDVVIAAVVVVIAVALHVGLDNHGHPEAAVGLTLLPLFIIAGVAIVGRLIRHRAFVESRLRTTLDTSEQRGQALALSAVAAERERIARDLHDLVGHGLSVIAVQAMAARANLDRGAVAEADAKLGTVEQTARATLEEMRRLVAMTADTVAELAPPPRLTDLERLMAPVREAGIPVTMTVDERLGSLPSGLEQTIYRIVQESLTNALKHASRPLTLQVALRAEADDIVIEVSDSGVPVAGPRPGRGITGMIERAALYGGTLMVAPGPSGGMRVLARFPSVVTSS